MKNQVEKFSQADELIKTLHVMDNNELKFMFYALSKREKGETEIITTVTDILKKLHIDDGGNQIKTFNKTMKSIRMKSDMTVLMKADRLSQKERDALGLQEDDIVEVGGSLISTKRNVKTNKVTIQFKPEFLPLLDDLKYNHTWIYLEQVSRLEGKYSARFYEFCKMQLKDKSKTKFVWYIDDDSKKAPGIRQFLNLTNKYNDWRNLHRRVIIPSIEEINDKCSDMYISYEVLKSKWVYGIELTLTTYNPKIVIETHEAIADFTDDIKSFKWWDN